MDTYHLFASAVREGLPTKFIGQRVAYYAFRDSTMRAAKEEIKQGAPAGTLIVAETQIGGHGRLGRSWLSPKGNLALSLIIYPSTASLPYLVMVASLALTAAIETTTGLKPELKWPNDLLLHGKKLSGILVESGILGDKACYAVVGVGVNINMRVPEYAEIASTATSLSDELGRPVARLALLREFLKQFERYYEMLDNPRAVFSAWRGKLTTLGKVVSVIAGDETNTGVAEDVAEDGNLLLRTAEGNLLKFAAGDVSLSNVPSR